MSAFIKQILICFCVVFFCPTLVFGQYPWPVPNMYEQHPIIGTLGEFRGFGRVLHEGVDIGEPTNHCQWSQGFNLQFLTIGGRVWALNIFLLITLSM